MGVEEVLVALQSVPLHSSDPTPYAKHCRGMWFVVFLLLRGLASDNITPLWRHQKCLSHQMTSTYEDVNLTSPYML